MLLAVVMNPTTGLQAEQASVTEYLSGDHRRLDAILADVVHMVDDGEMERADYVFAEFDAGLRRHIRIEEDVVFPLFEARTGAGGPPQVMRFEHREIQQLLARMRDALDRGDAASFRAAHRDLGSILPHHDMKEERILYPATDRAMSPVERANLVERIRRY